MNDITNPLTDFLYAQPSFLGGIGRALNLFGRGAQYNFSSTGDKADRQAIAADWRVVGDDLRQAMKSMKAEEDNARRMTEDIALNGK